MPWLADPTQAPSPSWLTSPAVVFLGFVGTVISIVQRVVAVGKWVSGTAALQDSHRRLLVVFSTACVAASAILAPVTWTAVVAADIGTGDPHWVSQIYPIIPCIMVLTGCSCLAAFDSPEKKRPSLLALADIAIGLISPALAYSFAVTSSAWERSCVDALPALALVLVVPLFLAYAKKSISTKIPDVRSGSAA